MDEDVLEAWRRFANVHAGPLAQRSERPLQGGAIMAADVQRGAEKGDMLDTGLAFELRQQLANIGTFDDKCDQARLPDDLLHRAARDNTSEIDKDHAVAAFRLIHVMGADQDGEPALAEMVDLLPEIA